MMNFFRHALFTVRGVTVRGGRKPHSFTRTHSPLPLTDLSSPIHFPLLRYPLPPFYLVCGRSSPPPALALCPSPNRHPFLYIPPSSHFVMKFKTSAEKARRQESVAREPRAGRGRRLGYLIETEVGAAIGKEPPRRSERSKASELFVEKHEVYSSCAPAASQTQDKGAAWAPYECCSRRACDHLQAVCLQI